MSVNSKTLLLTVLKNIDEAVIGASPDLQILFANNAAEQLLKYNSSDLTSKKIDQILDNYTPVESSLQKEAFCLDSANNKIPVSINSKKITDNHNKAIGYIYILKDITEIKKYLQTIEEKTKEIAQKNNSIEQLREEIDKDKVSSVDKVKQRIKDFEEEHARLLASINNLNLGFLMTDKYKNILLFNKIACDFLPALENKSKSIIELQQAENIKQNLTDEIEKSMQENKTCTMPDIQINSKYVNLYISPVILDKNTITECLGAVILIENKTQQHDLDESKEDLFSIASHELRTPLTAIYGYTSLIKQIYFEDLQNEELIDIINNIGVLSKKLSQNVNNFLDSQKLEQGKIELKKENCDLYTIINEAIKENEKFSQEKNLYIKFNFPPSPITVLGDQKRLIQIMTILINNAIKFTNIGGITISVEKIQNLVKISVQDTGSGIPDENKILLFNKFQQAEENLLTRQEGTGLGLHIAKLLIEIMGGSIRLENTEVNKGSTFSVTIPILQ